MATMSFVLNLTSGFLVQIQFFLMLPIQLDILNQWYEIVFQMILKTLLNLIYLKRSYGDGNQLILLVGSVKKTI